MSDGPPDANTVLAWLDELIEQTCAIPPVLVGKGPGGALAARFAIEHGDRSVPNPIDPRTIRAGESVELSQEFYAGNGQKASYRGLQLELGYDEGKRVSAGVSRVNPNTLRVYVGDEDFVRNALSLGIGTDAGRPWMASMTAACVAAVVLAALARVTAVVRVRRRRAVAEGGVDALQSVLSGGAR